MESPRLLNYDFLLIPLQKEEEKIRTQLKDEESALRKIVDGIYKKEVENCEKTQREKQDRSAVVLRLRIERRKKRLAELSDQKVDAIWGAIESKMDENKKKSKGRKKRSKKNKVENSAVVLNGDVWGEVIERSVTETYEDKAIHTHKAKPTKDKAREKSNKAYKPTGLATATLPSNQKGNEAPNSSLQNRPQKSAWCVTVTLDHNRKPIKTFADAVNSKSAALKSKSARETLNTSHSKVTPNKQKATTDNTSKPHENPLNVSFDGTSKIANAAPIVLRSSPNPKPLPGKIVEPDVRKRSVEKCPKTGRLIVADTNNGALMKHPQAPVDCKSAEFESKQLLKRFLEYDIQVETSVGIDEKKVIDNVPNEAGGEPAIAQKTAYQIGPTSETPRQNSEKVQSKIQTSKKDIRVKSADCTTHSTIPKTPSSRPRTRSNTQGSPYDGDSLKSGKSQSPAKVHARAKTSDGQEPIDKTLNTDFSQRDRNNKKHASTCSGDAGTSRIQAPVSHGTLTKPKTKADVVTPTELHQVKDRVSFYPPGDQIPHKTGANKLRSGSSDLNLTAASDVNDVKLTQSDLNVKTISNEAKPSARVVSVQAAEMASDEKINQKPQQMDVSNLNTNAAVLSLNISDCDEVDVDSRSKIERPVIQEMLDIGPLQEAGDVGQISDQERGKTEKEKMTTASENKLKQFMKGQFKLTTNVDDPTPLKNEDLTKAYKYKCGKDKWVAPRMSDLPDMANASIFSAVDYSIESSKATFPLSYSNVRNQLSSPITVDDETRVSREDLEARQQIKERKSVPNLVSTALKKTTKPEKVFSNYNFKRDDKATMKFTKSAGDKQSRANKFRESVFSHDSVFSAPYGSRQNKISPRSTNKSGPLPMKPVINPFGFKFNGAMINCEQATTNSARKVPSIDQNITNYDLFNDPTRRHSEAHSSSPTSINISATEHLKRILKVGGKQQNSTPQQPMKLCPLPQMNRKSAMTHSAAAHSAAEHLNGCSKPFHKAVSRANSIPAHSDPPSKMTAGQPISTKSASSTSITPGSDNYMFPFHEMLMKHIQGQTQIEHTTHSVSHIQKCLYCNSPRATPHMCPGIMLNTNFPCLPFMKGFPTHIPPPNFIDQNHKIHVIQFPQHPPPQIPFPEVEQTFFPSSTVDHELF